MKPNKSGQGVRIGASVTFVCSILPYMIWGKSNVLVYLLPASALALLFLVKSRLVAAVLAFAAFLGALAVIFAIPKHPGGYSRIGMDRTVIERAYRDYVMSFRQTRGAFPSRLSVLSKLDADCWRSFVSPGGFGVLDTSHEGILSFWLRRAQARAIYETRDLDNCAYVYLKPETDAADLIVIATRPMVLYGNAINVCYASGRVETFYDGTWEQNQAIVAFFRSWEAATGKDLQGI